MKKDNYSIEEVALMINESRERVLRIIADRGSLEGYTFAGWKEPRVARGALQAYEASFGHVRWGAVQ